MLVRRPVPRTGAWTHDDTEAATRDVASGYNSLLVYGFRHCYGPLSLSSALNL